MILIYKTPTCAYCKQVAKYLDHVGVKYEFRDIDTPDYVDVSHKFGFTVPLVLNTETLDGMVGYNIPRLREIVGL